MAGNLGLLLNVVKSGRHVLGTVERRERERQELRTRILDAARELFAEEGYDAVTMRKIADRIEYSPTAIYFHFRDKHALMRELVDARFRLARARVPEDREDRRPRRPAPQDRPGLRRLRDEPPEPLPADVHDAAPGGAEAGRQPARSTATPRRTPTPSSRRRSPRRSPPGASAPSSRTPTSSRSSSGPGSTASFRCTSPSARTPGWTGGTRPRSAHAQIDVMIRGLTAPAGGVLTWPSTSRRRASSTTSCAS